MVRCRYMHRAAIALAVGTSTLAARPALAEESEHDRAVALFAEARRLIEMSDCAGAVPMLQESLAREPSIGARFSLADCTRDADPYGAYWHLREAALLAFIKHDDRLRSAEDQAAFIVSRTGGIRFDVDAVDLRAPGFDLRIDGRSVDRFHLSGPIAIPPGEHRIVATVADGRRYEDSARVTSGGVILNRVVLVRPPEVGSPSPSGQAALPSPSRDPLVSGSGADGGGLSGRRALALGVAGGGMAALAVATAFGVVALEKRGEIDRACNGDRSACTGDPSVVDPVLDSADKNASISTILFIVGGALIAGGATLWFTEPKSAPRNAAVLRW